MTTQQPMSVTVTPFDNKPYGFAITVESTDANLQRVYDWAFNQFGLDAGRWSISGSQTFYVKYQSDADAIKRRWDGVPQTDSEEG